MIDRPLGVFFKHFGYFECNYESVVSSGCPVLLGGYLEVDYVHYPIKNNSLEHFLLLVFFFSFQNLISHVDIDTLYCIFFISK